jgi:hypothetical protein
VSGPTSTSSTDRTAWLFVSPPVAVNYMDLFCQLRKAIWEIGVYHRVFG